jgi:hypothetical protein
MLANSPQNEAEDAKCFFDRFAWWRVVLLNDDTFPKCHCMSEQAVELRDLEVWAFGGRHSAI